MTPGQCHAARILLAWPVRDLAKRAHVLNTTVEKLEAGLTVPRGVPESMRYQLELVGVRFHGDWGVFRRCQDENASDAP